MRRQLSRSNSLGGELNEYAEFLSQKVFLVEYEAMKSVNSTSVEELQKAIKEIIKITTGSPSYIKERREHYEC